jgi:mono/diheme cytochrome c family protein
MIKACKVLISLAVLFVFLIISNGTESKVQTKDESKAQVSISGKDLFQKHCVRCHGENGEGGKGPALNTEKKQAKWRDSDKKLIEKISKGGFGMPKFSKKLTSEEIKAIADYVRTLKAR